MLHFPARPAPNISRVAGVTIKDSAFRNVVPANRAQVLFRALDLYTAAEHRARAHFNPHRVEDKIDVNFHSNWRRGNTSMIGPLRSNYPALVRSLRLLKINGNDYDESTALGAFAALATNLQELSIRSCGLTSVRGLEKRCDFLLKVDLFECKHLSSIDGLGAHEYLEEVEASCTAIPSIEPLRSCPALTKVDLWHCQQLSSLEGLDGHRWLREVDASRTPIQSVASLRTCPALTKVRLYNCHQLASIQGLEGHTRLKEVDASLTAITSIEPLRSCPVLTKVELHGCRHIDGAILGLPPSVKVLR